MASLGGFKAIAYAAEDLTSPVAPYQCSLVFRCDNVAQRATVLLVCEVPTREAAHSFVLQYDADALQPSPGGLDSDNSHVPKAQLDDLLRAKDSRKSAAIKTLVLRLAQPCPLWSPGSRIFSPAPGSEPPLADFIHLARATTVHIVFDYKYVPKQHASMMRSFSKGKGLLGFPVDRLLVDLGLRKASWDIFGPADAAGAPPAYANPRKRARQPSSTSPRQSPKRVPPQSPTESHASDKTVPMSPATTEAIQKGLRKGAPAFDYQTEAIDAAVARQLSLYLDKTLPATLRDSLSALFTSAASRSTHNSPHPSSPPRNSTSPAPSLYSSSPPPPPPQLPTLTPVAQTLLPHLTAHLTSQFSAQQAALLARFTHNLNAMADSAAYDRTHETEAMLEEVEDMRAEMSVLRDDAVGDLQRGVSDVMERGSKEIDELEERIEEVYREAEGRIEEVRVWFEGLKAGVYGLVRMEARREAMRLMRRRREVRRGVGKKAGRAEMRLLGRRREAEEVEWVDV